VTKQERREGKVVGVNRITEPYPQYFAFPNTFSSPSTRDLQKELTDGTQAIQNAPPTPFQKSTLRSKDRETKGALRKIMIMGNVIRVTYAVT
jgi:hypothetical protein